MVKKRKKAKREPWNKGREVGQRAPLSLQEVTRIKKMLTKRGAAGVRQLAMFSTAIDSMLRAQDLLGLMVKDVRKRNKVMRDTLDLEIERTGQTVQCILSKSTQKTLEKLIEQFGKKQNDYLFTGKKGVSERPMTARQLGRHVKSWTAGIGLDETAYGTETLRRTRALHILNKTGNLEAVQILLGLTDIQAAARYLSGSKPVDALAINRAHMFS